MRSKNLKKNIVLALSVILVLFIAFSFLGPDFFRIKYDAKHFIASASHAQKGKADPIAAADPIMAEHIVTPVPLKALYMTSWVAGSPNIRTHIIDLLDKTEANAVVIDIKDYTGMIAFTTGDAELDATPCIERRIRDIGSLIETLHSKGVYVIGRVAVFQDPCYVKNYPDVAVKRKSDGEVWKDDKGLSWVDMGARDAWAYNVKIAKASYDLGFDEINFDYVRFPSDGNMKDISFVSGATPKPEVFKSFFQYLDQELRGGKAKYEKIVTPPIAATSSTASVANKVGTSTVQTTKMSSGMTVTKPTNMNGRASDPVFDEYYSLITSSDKAAIAKRSDLHGRKLGAGRLVTSADLFGMTTTVTDDLGIGQVLDYALPYVDYVYPMVYPSHYPPTWNGFKNPAAKPYEVIKISMQGAIDRAKALSLNPQKLRPWLQDFDLGATYTADMIRTQIQATYDLGLSGWLLWDAKNRYTPGGLLAN